MAVPDIYFDNNETIYTSVRTLDGSVGAGASEILTFGLSDLAELPGQSTWFVNKLQFQISGYMNIDGSATGDTSGFWMAAVLPRDQAGNTFDSLSDLQDYKAWPLKGCFGWTLCQAADINPVNNRFSVTRTYSPRKALVLNREQNLYFIWDNVSGPDCTVQLAINGQFKRGD